MSVYSFDDFKVKLCVWYERNRTFKNLALILCPVRNLSTRVIAVGKAKQLKRRSDAMNQ